MTAAAFVLLAALGAAVRCIATDGWPGSHRGTLLVNVAGALGLGVAAAHVAATLVLGIAAARLGLELTA